jgi:hypothetical protein
MGARWGEVGEVEGSFVMSGAWCMGLFASIGGSRVVVGYWLGWARLGGKREI